MSAKLDQLAEAISEHLMPAHRGVFEMGGRLIAFGNDGYETCENSRRQVRLFRDWLRDHHVAEVAFGTDPTENHAWVLVLDAPSDVSVEAVTSALWKARY